MRIIRNESIIKRIPLRAAQEESDSHEHHSEMILFHLLYPKLLLIFLFIDDALNIPNCMEIIIILSLNLQKTLLVYANDAKTEDNLGVLRIKPTAGSSHQLSQR
jgi:hypothetical protein